MDSAERDLLPLRQFLAQQGWPQEITTYDMYGGHGLTVMLEPEPSPDQLQHLVAAFGETYEFEQVSGTLQ